MKKRIYDVSEEGKVIMAGVTAGEIKSFFSMSGMKMTDYTRTGYKIKGRYTIMDAGLIEQGKRAGIEKTFNMPERFWESWRACCNMFQNVTWVQQWEPGVKVLKGWQ